MPPGFCITTKALEKHLQLHTELKAAIQDIEAANENYEEAYFKEQCQKYVYIIHDRYSTHKHFVAISDTI